VLQVGINQYHRIAAAAGLIQAGEHRRFLAEVAGELDQADRYGCRLIPADLDLAVDHGGGVVAGAVVDQEELLRNAQCFDRADERPNPGGFVEAGGHHPEAGRRCGARGRAHRAGPIKRA
jgi:hypothetical protein